MLTFINHILFIQQAEIFSIHFGFNLSYQALHILV
jgi:hypothetical protein